jgi:hypothetical protein
MGTPSKLGFNLDPTFFGYDNTHSVHVHELIFDMIWYSDGRFDWDTLYYMPIYLRTFYLKKINQKIEERNSK